MDTLEQLWKSLSPGTRDVLSLAAGIAALQGERTISSRAILMALFSAGAETVAAQLLRWAGPPAEALAVHFEKQKWSCQVADESSLCRLDDQSARILSAAIEESGRCDSPYCMPEHIVVALLSVPDTDAQRLLSEFDVDIPAAQQKMRELLSS